MTVMNKLDTFVVNSKLEEIKIIMENENISSFNIHKTNLTDVNFRVVNQIDTLPDDLKNKVKSLITYLMTEDITDAYFQFKVKGDELFFIEKGHRIDYNFGDSYPYHSELIV